MPAPHGYPPVRPTRPVFLSAAFLAVAGLALLGFQLAAPAKAVLAKAVPAKPVTAAAAVNGEIAAQAARAATAITPVATCASLATADLSQAAPGAPTEITSASVTTYNGASFCDVQGVQPPQLQFDLKLPVSTWTGRYVQAGCGGYCGSVGSVAPQAATNCPPGADNSSCLTPAQVAVVVKLYQGPRDSRGQNLYPGGEPYGSELAWTPWFITAAGDTA